MMRIGVVGSRDFDWSDISKSGKELDGYTETNVHTKAMRDMIAELVSNLQTTDYVVSGGADGADYWGEAFAHAKKKGRIIHEADWNRQPDGTYDRSAGPRRNALIVADADMLFAYFTDMTTSRGTLNCVGQAQKARVPIYLWDAKTNKWYHGVGQESESLDYREILDANRQ